MEIVTPGGQQGLRMSLSRDERDFAGEYLEFTKKMLLDSVEGLSERDMKKRRGPFEWSVAECIGHLALAGEATWRVMQDLLAEPSVEKKPVRISVKQLMVIMTDRSRKLQTLPVLHPTNKFPDAHTALKQFMQHRQRLVDFARSTDDELKNRYTFHRATGFINLYQFLLLEGAHTARHVMQIEEIKGGIGR